MKKNNEAEALYKKRFLERLQQDEEAQEEIDEFLTEEEQDDLDDTNEQISNDIRQ